MSEPEGVTKVPSPRPPRRWTGLVLFALASLGFAGWIYFFGGRATLERWISRLGSKGPRIGAREAVQRVRAMRGGPQNQTVTERLEVLADRLDQHGISLTERRWDCTEDPKQYGFEVTCLLRAKGYENRMIWLVDYEGTSITPSNGPAAELDALDVMAAGGQVPSWAPRPARVDVVDDERPPTMAQRPSRHTPAAPPSARKTGRPAGPPPAGEITLLGVVSGSDGVRAVLRIHSGDLTVRVGQKVEGWTVGDIRNRSHGESTVVLKRGRDVRELSMSSPSTASAPAPAPAPAPAAPAPDPKPSEPSGKPPEPGESPPARDMGWPSPGPENGPPRASPSPQNGAAGREEIGSI